MLSLLLMLWLMQWLCYWSMSIVIGQCYYEHIGLVVRMSILDTEVDGSNPSISMFSP